MEEFYVFVSVEGSNPIPFKLMDYDAQAGGYLGRKSTLAKLKVANLEVWEEPLQAFVSVELGKEGQRFKANTPETALRMRGPAATTLAELRTDICCWFAVVALAIGIPMHQICRDVLHSKKVFLATLAQKDPAINTILSALEAASFVGVVGTSVRSMWAGIRRHLRPHAQPRSRTAQEGDKLHAAAPAGTGPSG
eukprot:CAMPEP_0202857138 /NCGR_PEP_ID=MMETSP1391-20130828/188_1 /ASSEMBLY_ACC=CAM_ASM_000867 /TAXON_ID=1034604 /ORGANISM="Chlamydomonas leiostraca, Strain SAG 11-49" /LENGTH=193 /DNA_ID=CAMNT_0049535901 /DNA_START=96 /DNA_END=677 /DNA_ORIENTATION=+